MNKKTLAYISAGTLAFSLLVASGVSAHGLGVAENTQDFVARQTAMFSEQAVMLGITVDDVKAAWAEGKSLQQLAEEKGISQADLQKKMQDYRETQLKDRLQALVSAGVITQAQADARLSAMSQKKFGQGMGRHGARGGAGSFRGW